MTRKQVVAILANFDSVGSGSGSDFVEGEKDRADGQRMIALVVANGPFH
jgi:hypothetical protein